MNEQPYQTVETLRGEGNTAERHTNVVLPCTAQNELENNAAYFVCLFVLRPTWARASFGAE